MTRLVLYVLAMILLPQSSSFALQKEQTLTVKRFGRVVVYRNEPEPKNMILFVSGDGGWNSGTAKMARSLVDLDTTVVGIDIRTLLKSMESGDLTCTYPAADFEHLSQSIQKTLKFRAYHRPILVGYSAGATMVYGLMGQAPRGTFLGAISLGYCREIETNRRWCTGGGLTSRKSADGKSLTFSTSRSLTEPWYILQGRKDLVCRFDQASAVLKSNLQARLVSLPTVGHDFSNQRAWLPDFKRSFNAIIRSKITTQALPARAGALVTESNDKRHAADVSKLPLIEVPVSRGQSDTLALLITGDGGWAGLDRAVSAGLASNGVPVVGFDSLSYFWNRRTPAETESAVERTLRHYVSIWGKQRIILIGYSFGADVLPFVISRLPKDLKNKLRLVTIISPSQDAEFEFHVADWAGLSLGETYPTLPEFRKSPGTKVLCLYGISETESLCPKLGKLGKKSIGLPGGHDVGGDFQRLVREILSASR